MAYLQHHARKGEVVTGLLYVEERCRRTCTTQLSTVATPLNRMGEDELCPGSAKLADVNAEYR